MSNHLSNIEIIKPSEVPFKTYFAPAERMDKSEVGELLETVMQSDIIRALLDSVDGLLLVLNRERQILATNRTVMDAFNVKKMDALVGLRPGELFHCIHSDEESGGCGTSRACATCGAVQSILQCQNLAEPVAGECNLTLRVADRFQACEFRVRTTPVTVSDYTFYIMALSDISGDKRRMALERIFFHDVLNTLTGLQGWTQLLKQPEKVDLNEASGWIMSMAGRLQREIVDQRTLVMAEADELKPNEDLVELKSLFADLEANFREHDVAGNRHLEFGAIDKDPDLFTDGNLLFRVLENMIKNALEFIPEGETVRVTVESGPDKLRFNVWNPGYIPEKTALQIFNRSFSTKSDSGRGLGTYSMRLLGETYLGGKVDFVTDEKDGTTFWIEIPI